MTGIRLLCPDKGEELHLPSDQTILYVNRSRHDLDHVVLTTGCGSGFVFWTGGDVAQTAALLVLGVPAWTFSANETVRAMRIDYDRALRLPSSAEHGLRQQLIETWRNFLRHVRAADAEEVSEEVPDGLARMHHFGVVPKTVRGLVQKGGQ